MIVADAAGAIVVPREIALEFIHRLEQHHAANRAYFEAVRSGEFSNAWVDRVLDEQSCPVVDPPREAAPVAAWNAGWPPAEAVLDRAGRGQFPRRKLHLGDRFASVACREGGSFAMFDLCRNRAVLGTLYALALIRAFFRYKNPRRQASGRHQVAFYNRIWREAAERLGASFTSLTSSICEIRLGRARARV